MEDLLVSVIIPTYSRPKSLKRAIESVLNQSYKSFEIIVVDDNCSNTLARKETEELIQNYLYLPNFKYLKHTENMNGAAARNTGILASEGYYICFLDDDDYFLKDKLKNQVARLSLEKDHLGICYSNFYRMENNKLLDKGVESLEGYLVPLILQGGFFISAGSNLMLKKEVAIEIGGFNVSFPRRQDLEFLIRANQKAKIIHSPTYDLVIDKSDKSNRLNVQDLKKNNSLFLESFKEDINNLDTENKEKVLVALDLELFKHEIMKKEFKHILRYKNKYKIRFSLLIKYILYLLNRRIRKLCYGFKI